MNTYTVITGDTMWKIASKNGVGLSELLAANPQITNSSLIFPGQKINIPKASNGTETPNGSVYTVLAGDTMWKIASINGVGLSELLAANPQITNSSLIFVGQKINIPKAGNGTETPSDSSSLVKEVIRLVNVERTKVGLPSLTESSELNNVADIKSKDFVSNNYFAHNSPTYGTPFEMLRSFGVSFTAAGENIASGQKTAADVMNSWMNSSGHRANILNTSYNKIGVGVAKDSSGNTYWTQMFIKG